METYPLLIGQKKVYTEKKLIIFSPYTQEPIAEVCLATEKEIEKAILVAQKAFETLKHSPAYIKANALLQISEEVKKQSETLAKTMAEEAGKPISLARIEVQRCIELFRYAAEETKRFGGEIIPLDLDKLSEKRMGVYKRFPIGPILGITPFNFPLNLIAHKVAPAIAVGNPVIIKPASATPITALIFGEIVSKIDLPEGALSILPCSTDLAEKMVKDDRLAMLTFTGSPEVGWYLKGIAGRKRVTLELGGNAALVIASLRLKDFLLQRAIFGAFYQAGQVCISIQRIFIKEDLYKEFLEDFLESIKKIKSGDPLDEDVLVGPLINKGAADRVETWVNEAIEGGAKLLIGGKREGNVIYPTVLTNTSPEMKVNAKEIFGPVVTVEPFREFKEAINMVNDSIYGLQTGIFTDNLNEVFYAYNHLDVGGVIINDIPTYRSDPMPYGGVKLSGLGKEGIRYAMKEMSEGKLLVINYA
ncbi:MAG TPA: aldehyde dehydrogenase family protein [Candidatus Desulfofervidus auxilii]|uniref:Aldehyde dehydrogenase family protein n=1 Tax=Desulfofervidus auxilii TaxID=1621989 RepID=A0A7V0NE94_DESA2|nr:aldehyde dehydrogenase family protein [Candidatus Desulfofervidus auxilii]